MKIEAIHHFHKQPEADEWAQKFEPTPERLALFETILNEIQDLEVEELHILELGVGPGFLAKFLLEHIDGSYQGVDFAQPMLKIANKRLHEFSNKISLTQADLTSNWIPVVNSNPQVIVSTWALHDLMSKNKISAVYNDVFQILPKGGLFLNGDFIKPETSTFDYEEGRIKPSTHLELLKKAGFTSYQCLRNFEVNVEYPTTSNNYSCFKAVK